MQVNDFHTDLQYSTQCSEEPFWQEVYKQAFPDMVFAEMVSKDCQGQRLGIDRVVHLSTGKTLYIDEKKRREVYDDILLEYKSNSNKLINDGWINKDLLVDYIAYAFMPTKKVYLLDWRSLKRAWVNNGQEWWDKAQTKTNGFRLVSANNNYYQTLSIVVPINILLTAITTPIIVTL